MLKVEKTRLTVVHYRVNTTKYHWREGNEDLASADKKYLDPAYGYHARGRILILMQKVAGGRGWGCVVRESHILRLLTSRKRTFAGEFKIITL